MIRFVRIESYDPGETLSEIILEIVSFIGPSLVVRGLWLLLRIESMQVGYRAAVESHSEDRSMTV